MEEREELTDDAYNLIMATIEQDEREEREKLVVKHGLAELDDETVEAELAFRILGNEDLAQLARAGLEHKKLPARDVLAILMELECKSKADRRSSIKDHRALLVWNLLQPPRLLRHEQ